MAAESARRGRFAGVRGTIRLRTTIAATLVVGLALALAAAGLLSTLRAGLVHDLDQVAELHAADIAAAAHTGRLSTPIAADQDEIVQVLDRHGHVIAASANAAGQAPIVRSPVSGSEPLITTITGPFGLPGSYRVVGVLSSSPNPVTVFVATNQKEADATVRLVRNAVLWGVPFLLGLIAFLAWLAVGRALRPVEAIRSRVADISSKDLSGRVPVPPEDGEIGRLAQTMNAMLDRLQAAADRQRHFVADASHELQSPLAASRTDLEVALAHPSSKVWPVTARDLLAQNNRMQRLVADLLFLARGDTGPALTEPAPVDLHELVLAEATHAPGHGRVTVDVSAVEPAFVLGRADDLRRAVRNLLENACEHANTTVSVVLRTAGDTVRLVVEDDGPGVPVGDRARIFERFARLDTARSRTTGGTGLGLAIVKEAVERHHGLVRVEDSPSGARFVVTLPPD